MVIHNNPIKDSFAHNHLLWNSGLFLFQAKSLIKAMRENCPSILFSTLSCWKHSEFTKESSNLSIELNLNRFLSIPVGCINEDVIKKSDDTIMFPCDINWLGTNPHSRQFRPFI